MAQSSKSWTALQKIRLPSFSYPQEKSNETQHEIRRSIAVIYLVFGYESVAQCGRWNPPAQSFSWVRSFFFLNSAAAHHSPLAGIFAFGGRPPFPPRSSKSRFSGAGAVRGLKIGGRCRFTTKKFF